MIVGLDFDNTLVCYDDVFPALARERGLVGDAALTTKAAVRAHLRAAGREPDWTRLQGEVYGPSIGRAPPFPGALDAVRRLVATGARVVVVSHKTAAPILGEAHDLIAAARGWLAANGFFAPGALSSDDAWFEPTKEAKLARIAALGCAWFVDDLPEVLSDSGFPPGVGRLLFDPHGAHEQLPMRRASSWRAVVDLLAAAATGDDDARPDDDAAARDRVRTAVAELLGASTLVLAAAPAGGNSRVWRARVGDAAYLAKQAPPRRPGERDRAAREFLFASFLWRHGERRIPRPVALDGAQGIGVYEYVDGVPVDVILPSHVDQAIAFAAALQRLRDAPDAGALGDAADACFTTDAHLRVVDERLERLRSVDDAPRDARAFIEDELAPRWASVRAEAARAPDLHDVVPVEHRVLSPSDFGFHNAIRRPDGALVFFDFEYAGWDDPAKMVVDFFLQPARLVPSTHVDAFIAAIAAPDARERLRMRAAGLRPVLRVKWATILLNELVPRGWARRAFAGRVDRTTRISEQVVRARALLAGDA